MDFEKVSNFLKFPNANLQYFLKYYIKDSLNKLLLKQTIYYWRISTKGVSKC